jgi:hypothetical protein
MHAWTQADARAGFVIASGKEQPRNPAHEGLSKDPSALHTTAGACMGRALTHAGFAMNHLRGTWSNTLR